jgi:enoyl-CoA hydratase/carnithine racemase
MSTKHAANDMDQINEKSNLQIHDFSWCGSLFEPSSQPHINRLRQILDHCRTGEIHIIRVRGECHDYSNSWLEYLRAESMWSELYDRMHAWHIVFARIIQSKAKWFFLCDGDVVGSWWELALSCHGRILANPYAKVGFPDIFIDIFAPLASTAFKRFLCYENTETLADRAIMHARDAYKLGLINLCLLDSFWINDAAIMELQTWFQKFIPQEDVKLTPKHDYVRRLYTKDQIESERMELTNRRQWLNAIRVQFGPKFWREKSVQTVASMASQHLAAVAMRFLMPDYQAWLSRRIARYRLGSHDHWWITSSNYTVIDVTGGTPPQDVLNCFLARRKHLLFTSEDPNKLKSALEVVRPRFDRNKKPSDFSTWDDSVHWFCMNPKEDAYAEVVCSFNQDDTLIVRRGAHVQPYFRISGNFGHAGVGWCEKLPTQAEGPEHDRLEAEETVGLMSNGLLTAHRYPIPNMPLTICLRYVLYECMQRQFSQLRHIATFQDYLKLLAQSNWGFASDLFQWEQLFKAFPPGRYDLAPLLKLFQCNSKDQLRTLTPMMNKSKPTHASSVHENFESIDIRSGAGVTRLLALFSYRVYRWLIENQYVTSTDEANLFITLSWGYPGSLRPPSTFLRDFGAQRVEYWSQKFGRGQENLSELG